MYENTIIVTENNEGINSERFLGYAIYRVAEYDENDSESISFRLIACSENTQDNKIIRSFSNASGAANALSDLLKVLGEDNILIWNANDAIPF